MVMSVVERSGDWMSGSGDDVAEMRNDFDGVGVTNDAGIVRSGHPSTLNLDGALLAITSRLGEALFGNRKSFMHPVKATGFPNRKPRVFHPRCTGAWERDSNTRPHPSPGHMKQVTLSMLSVHT